MMPSAQQQHERATSEIRRRFGAWLIAGSLAVATGLSALSLGTPTMRAAVATETDAVSYNRLLGRGMNLGNALDAPKEGAWGITLAPGYFSAIKEAGFNSVRVPIRWSAHAGNEPPYTIEPAFFARVDWAVEQALSRGLVAIINVHHNDEIHRDPATGIPRLVALWKQIAAHYRSQPERLYFELLNEPHDQLTDERWQAAIPELLQAVRDSNPDRVVIIGPGNWNDAAHLPALRLPSSDPRLIVTFHYYKPFPFTHQGSPAVRDSGRWRGTVWNGTSEERAQLRNDFDAAAAWAERNHRPLFLGEFGARRDADMTSRASWTRAVAREAERRGFSWAYWEFGSDFGAYDLAARSWHAPLLQALMDRP